MLKFAFPLMAGIAFSYITASGVWLTLALFVLSLAVLFVGVYGTAPRWLFGVAVTVSLFLLGMLSEQGDRRKMDAQWSGYKGRYEAVLLEVPMLGERTARVRADVTRIGRDSLSGARRSGIVNIYFANSVEAEQLRIGQRLYFEANVTVPKSNGNPAEFDSELYAYVNGVTGMVYLPVGAWHIMGNEKYTLRMRALVLRERILKYFSSLNIEGDAFAVLSALTVGERRELSKTLRHYYAAAGAGHLLALSGLHIALFYMIFTLLLPVRNDKRILVVLRELTVVVFLWCFALMAGLSPSVVRASVLFTMMAVARCMRRDNSSLNSLALAAIIMLSIYPRWLFDVGFQMSFSAVAFILLLQRPLFHSMRGNEYGLCYRYVVGLLTVSLSAQIGTFPFLWYYFGTFPLYFLITNVAVVPVAFVIMLLSVLLVMVMPFPVLSSCVAAAVSVTLNALNGFLKFVASMPYASLELPYTPVAWLVSFSLLLYLVAAMLLFKRKRAASAVLVLLVAVWGCNMLFANKPIVPHLLFYNNADFPAVHAVYSKNKNYLVSTYPQWEISTQYVVEPYCRRLGADAPLPITDKFNDENIAYSDNLLRFEERRIALIGDDCPLDEDTLQPVDCVYLTRGFSGRIKELLLKYPTRYVLLDATLFAGSRKRIARECAELNVRCIDLTKGAVRMLCRKTGVRFEYVRGE